ncbi:unnamed protein product [Paramecium sonneborni]|uniref:Uncharacterized protein n=1 Tax=Paramecium sonneborni TaxID=65129 RepID=A0A8S1NAB6_9CILI|nr:unnamed protein product [Paramecium sonneborni]
MDPKQTYLTCLISDKNKVIEKQVKKDFPAIQEELHKINKEAQWIMSDFNYHIRIDQTNLSSCSKLVAVQQNDVSMLLEDRIKLKQLQEKYDKLYIEFQQEKQNAEKYRKMQKNLESEFFHSSDLKKEIFTQKEQIKHLEEMNLLLQNELDENHKHYEDYKKNSQITIKILNNDLSNLNLKNQSLELEKQEQQKEISNQSQQINTLEKENSNLSENNKSQLLEKNKSLEIEKIYLSEQIKQLEIEKINISEKFKLQEIEKNNLSEKIKFLEKTKNQIFSQDQLFQLLDDFYNNDQCYQENDNKNRQVQFLDQMLQKKILDEQIIDHRETNTVNFQFRLQQISLNMEKFRESINNNIFYKPSYIERGEEQNLSKKAFEILKNGQTWLIEDNYTMLSIKMKNYQIPLNQEQKAIDIINNLLVVEGFMQLYKEDLKKITECQFKQKQFDLQFPKQFLIQDDQNQFYVCEQIVKDQANQIYEAFNKETEVSQYINSFILYFYYCLNKNCVITKYDLNQNQQNQNLILSNMIISSNYFKTLSLLDEGKKAVDEFKEKITQEQSKLEASNFWTKELQRAAQKQWYNKK